jgi:saccharopine dehydrogenase (NAD+, L-lysine-forming)
MSRVTVLGGCGAVGSIAVRTLAALKDFSEVVIADIDAEKAKRMVGQLRTACLSATRVDALDASSVRQAIKGSDVVLNCVGPFYQFGAPILKAVIEAGINYVDISDDVDATRAQLDLSKQAERQGVSACIGMGSSPGVTNLLAKFAADQLLDEVEAIDLFHAHGGEPTEGAGVVGHRIHAMTSEIPVYLDGQYKTVRFFEPAGVALREEVEFRELGKYEVYPYPHPETITIPRYISCRRVTNKGTVLPDEYFRFIVDLVKLGVVGETPLEVKGQHIAPRDFAIAYIVHERDRILRKTKFGLQRGCVKIVVTGKKQGKLHQFVFSMASRGQAMGEGTGIPAAFGATLMFRGKIQTKGVLPPEACIKPLEFLAVMQEFLKLGKVTGKGSPLRIESIDAEGHREELSL